MIRETKQENDLFYLCSLIESIGRITKNKRIDVINAIGKEELLQIFNLADVYHCEPLEKTTDDFIARYQINTGNFDNVKQCKYTVPTIFDIGKVYKRLILYVADNRQIELIEALICVYASFVAWKIDDYNSSVYYENPQYLEKFFDYNNPPEFFEFYAEKFVNELLTSFTMLPDYVKRECDGEFTPFNFFKIMMRDTAKAVIDSPKIIAQSINAINECVTALNLSIEQFAVGIEADPDDVRGFYEEYKPKSA